MVLTAGTAQPTGQDVLERGAEISPEAAESMDFAELKSRQRQEAARYEREQAEAENVIPGEESQTQEEASDADATSQRTESSQSSDSTSESDQASTTEGRTRRQPATLDEAIQQVNALAGNLKTVAEERTRFQRELSELREAQQRSQQESEGQRLQAQHQAVLAEINRLPEEQRPGAISYYQSQLTVQQANDFARQVQAQGQQVAQRELAADKRDLPAMFEDIASYVCTQREVPVTEVLPLVQSPRIKALIEAAQTPEALRQVAYTVGELIDFESERIAGRLAAEKEARRQEAAKTPTARDTPVGGQPAGGDISQAQKIENMSPAEFLAYKKQQLDRVRGR